jgi:hypothetical protein
MNGTPSSTKSMLKAHIGTFELTVAWLLKSRGVRADSLMPPTTSSRGSTRTRPRDGRPKPDVKPGLIYDSIGPEQPDLNGSRAALVYPGCLISHHS